MDNNNENSGRDPDILRDEFTEEELIKIKSALAEKGFFDRPCNACGEKAHAVHTRPASPQFIYWDRETNLLSNYIFGPAAPVVLVFCQDCGNIWSFSLHLLGLMDDGSIKIGKDDSQNG